MSAPLNIISIKTRKVKTEPIMDPAFKSELNHNSTTIGNGSSIWKDKISTVFILLKKSILSLPL
jgi:hypothetical protein